MIPQIQSRRILFATIGSLGDLHPCFALALELKRRGHRTAIATTAYYRSRVENLGIDFYPVRPDMDPTDPGLISQFDDLKRGPEILIRDAVLPHLQEGYVDLLPIAAEFDLMISGELNFAAPLVAEKLGLRWASLTLSPVSFLSAHDPSVLVNVPWLFHVRRLGVPAYRAVMNLGRLGIRHWWEPVRQLRREQGLSPNADPLFRDKFSPSLVLALFSPMLAQPQTDWPPQTLQPGFVFYDQLASDRAATPELSAYLASGDPPIVFTQGSTAVHAPGNFYTVSAQVAAQLHRRAILIGTTETFGLPPAQCLALPYAPYSEVFPHAAVNVHQGGSGTTGQALRAGRPQLIVPFGWDQPDNAARVQRLGAGLHLPRKEYSVSTAAAALNRLIQDQAISSCAAQVGITIQGEDGLNATCDAIEALLVKQS